jgi:hypothetical protein
MLLARFASGYLLKNVSLIYSMECGSLATLGFTNEALGFVLFLRHILPVPPPNIHTKGPPDR